MNIKKILIIIGICLASIGLLSCSVLLFGNNNNNKNSNNSSGSSSSDEEIYTVTYDGNGATSVPVAYTRFKDYNKVNLVTPVKIGYTFDGWYEGDTKVEKITENRDYNLTAKFNIINYSISYELNGGSFNDVTYSLPTSYTIVSDDIILKDLDIYFEKEGYQFDGLYLDSNFTEPIDTIKSGSHENIKIYVKWSIPPTNVTYVLNRPGIETRVFTVDKSNNLNVITENDIPYKLVEPTYTPIAVNFLGWFDSENNRVEQITELSKDFVLTAKFEPRDIDIVFTWSPTGDKNDMFGTITRNIDSFVETFMSIDSSELEDVQWDTTNGYGHIISWTTNSEYGGFIQLMQDNLGYSGLRYNSMSKNLGDEVIVYPVYEPVYTITFDSNGGSDIEPLKMYTGVTFDMGSTDSFRSIKEGYNFLGWYNSNDELVDSLLYENLSEDVTLYAHWEETYTTYLSFYEEGEEISIDAEDVLYVFVPFSEGDLDVYYQQHYILDSLELNDLEFDGHEYDIYITYFDEDVALPAGFYLNFGVLDNTISYVGTLEQKIYKGENYCGDIYSFKIIENYSESITFFTFNDDYKLVKSFSNSSYEKIEGSLGIDEVTYYLYVSDELQNEELVTLGLFPNSSNSEVLGLFVGIYTTESSTNVHILLDNTFNDVSDTFTVCEFVKQCDGYAIFKFNLNIDILYDYNCDLLKINYSNSDLVYLINYNE